MADFGPVLGGLGSALARGVALLASTGVGRVGLVIAGLGLVLLVVVIPASVARESRFQREWAAYVTAHNQGRPIPARPPRFAQVAASLAHNQRADVLRSIGSQQGRASGVEWRDTGAVEVGLPPLLMAGVVSMATAIGKVVAVRSRPVGLCESCQLVPAARRVRFADDKTYRVCEGCRPVAPVADVGLAEAWVLQHVVGFAVVFVGAGAVWSIAGWYFGVPGLAAAVLIGPVEWWRVWRAPQVASVVQPVTGEPGGETEAVAS